jgi:hypothetical protein
MRLRSAFLRSFSTSYYYCKARDARSHTQRQQRVTCSSAPGVLRSARPPGPMLDLRTPLLPLRSLLTLRLRTTHSGWQRARACVCAEHAHVGRLWLATALLALMLLRAVFWLLLLLLLLLLFRTLLLMLLLGLLFV